MKTIEVCASSQYPVHIGSGALSLLPQVAQGRKVCIISDSNVWPLYGAAARKALEEAGLHVVHYLISPGENSKNLQLFGDILNFLAKKELQRWDCIMALGGGVVGDLAGFCAACFLRGIPYIQVPTTLLAAVDSSVGGKTAIDLPGGKNLVGAFYQPTAVLCDTDTLSTLPPALFRQGCSEVIKYGILYDEALFSHLEAQGPDFDRETVIARCVELKAQAVQADERDYGPRRMLNLGHTVAHAIEKESGYTISHGDAVAMGIAIVTRAAAKLGYCETSTCGRILRLLEEFQLPTHTDYPAEVLCRHALGDKKAEGKAISVILPRSIGKCDIVPMDESTLLRFIKAGV